MPPQARKPRDDAQDDDRSADARDGRDAEALTQAAETTQRELQAGLREDADQTLADVDRAQSDSDQSASDADQSVADAEQTLADRDQHASDRDQAAADWEHGHDGDPALAEDAHETSRAEREAASRERETTAASRSRTTSRRLATAALRDEMARSRDLTAEARDRVARARDEAAEILDVTDAERERSAAEAGDLDTIVGLLAALRRSSAALRHQTAQERRKAAADRAAAARDRDDAAAERHFAGLDELTGVYRRGTGELALTHEIGRSRRCNGTLVIAMLDVDALKAVNDSEGHAAGDRLLRDVATAIATTLRPYDITVRWGGDEFVCAITDVTPAVARARIDDIRQALRRRRAGASVSAGRALLQDDDTLDSLVARADAALYRRKAERTA